MNSSYIKIGYAKNVSQLLKNWGKVCKHDVRDYMKQLSGERSLVKHAGRVLVLLEAELKDIRFPENCCKGYKKRHLEWYRTTPEHATTQHQPIPQTINC